MLIFQCALTWLDVTSVAVTHQLKLLYNLLIFNLTFSWKLAYSPNTYWSKMFLNSETNRGSLYCTSILWFPAYLIIYQLEVIYFLFQYVLVSCLFGAAGFRKGKGIRDQIVKIHSIIEKAKEFQKNISFCFVDYTKAFDCVDHDKLWKNLRDGNTRPPYLLPLKSVSRSRSNS